MPIKHSFHRLSASDRASGSSLLGTPVSASKFLHSVNLRQKAKNTSAAQVLVSRGFGLTSRSTRTQQPLAGGFVGRPDFPSLTIARLAVGPVNFVR